MLLTFLPASDDPRCAIFLSAVLLAFCGAVLVQLLFWWGILARFAFFRAQNTALPQQQAAATSTVSIIICARNEAENLRRNLPDVLRQEFPNGAFEVIVVDDASTDDTPQVLADFEKNWPRLRVVRLLSKKSPGKKAALAAGIAAAKHENLLLTDADCRPSTPFWLAKMAAHLAQPGIEIVLGYAPFFADAQPSLLNRWARFEAAWTAMQYFSFALAGHPYMGVGRNLAWKKSLFEAVGGFRAHEDLASGDDDLFVNAAARADNTAICADPDTFVFSEAKRTWRDYFQQKTRHLSAGARYRRKHQIYLALGSASHTFCYSLMFLLLVFKGCLAPIFFLAIMRLFTAIFVLAPSLRKLRETRLLFWVPIFDAALAVFYGAFAFIIFFSNNNYNRPWTR